MPPLRACQLKHRPLAARRALTLPTKAALRRALLACTGSYSTTPGPKSLAAPDPENLKNGIWACDAFSRKRTPNAGKTSESEGVAVTTNIATLVRRWMLRLRRLLETTWDATLHGPSEVDGSNTNISAKRVGLWARNERAWRLPT